MVLALAPAAQAAVVQSADLGSAGTVIYTFTLDDNTTATTTFTAPSGVTSIKLAVVAGGGGGGYKNGGGGGAGGLLTNDSYTVTPGSTYTIQVGRGGDPYDWPHVPSYNGATSYFDSVISIGGGSGGDENLAGIAGGSGGGGAGNFGGGGGTPGQGYDGGGGGNFGGGGGLAKRVILAPGAPGTELPETAEKGSIWAPISDSQTQPA
jgi:hypothetical protein